MSICFSLKDKLNNIVQDTFVFSQKRYILFVPNINMPGFFKKGFVSWMEY